MPVMTEIRFGEFFDKFTILVNKVYNCKKDADVYQAILELMRLSQAIPTQSVTLSTMRETIQHFARHSSGVPMAIKELRDTNKELWELEELVRKEDVDSIRLDFSDKIRESNARRAESKANLDKFFRESTIEVKDYATGSKEPNVLKYTKGENL